MGALTGKTAIVTGGGQGIGRAIVDRFVSEGARVAVIDLSGREKEVERAYPEEVTAFHADVSDDHQMRGTVEEVAALFGGAVDVLCNNAGIDGPTRPLDEYPVGDFQHVLDVNLRGVFLGMKYVLPLMAVRGSGSVVNVASALATGTLPGQAPYGASKAGVVQLSRQAAWEYGSRGVRVNALSPGGVRTDIARRFFAEHPEHEAAFTAKHALGRLAEPAEVAAAALFLAGDDASFVTGTTLHVDAGWTAG